MSNHSPTLSLNAQLLRCVWSGDLDGIKKLLESGAKIDDDMLYYACMRDHIDVVEFLLQKGVPPDDRSTEVSCAHCHITIIIKLIEYGANVEACRKNWKFLFDHKAPKDLRAEQVKELLLAEAVRREIA